MKVSPEEVQAIKTVLELADKFGYGNLMNHLATRWAEKLMVEWNMTEEAAREGAFLPGYPFQMQRDILTLGMWDETGKRYMQ